MPKPPYQCPRCGFSSNHKGTMQRHLYDLKKPCPALASAIELTDDIKQHVLANRVYRVPAPVQPTAAKAKPKAKASIPKTLRLAVWKKHIGLGKGVVKCLCCEIIDIYQLDFECGHIEAEANGGRTTVENLLPICANCNRAMQTTNLYEFRRRHFTQNA